MPRLTLLLLLALPLSSALADAQSMLLSRLSEDEQRQILSLGPWPPPRRPDPSNHVSGKAQAIELGRRLFRDPRMSPVGYIACVSCHQPDRSFTDAKARAHGLADLPRNTPALGNFAQRRWFGWGGASDSLWMASIRPILDPREFDGSLHSISRLFERDPELAACYRNVFGTTPLAQPERTAANVGKALAAFQETFVTGRTPFDDFRDALAGKDFAAAAAYPEDALRGLKLFIGPAACVACHNGPNFSDGEFHRVMTADPEASAGMPGTDEFDTGRLADARRLLASPFNLNGRYNDDRASAGTRPTQQLEISQNMRGKFRTPGLRNVAVTAPYMHDGRLEHLSDVLQHPRPAPRDGSPTALNPQQLKDLSAFLLSLSDRYGERRPWSSESLVRCP